MNTRAFPNSPFLLGFERLERLVERSRSAAPEGYPPYNVEELPSDSVGNPAGLRLTLAVAGFAPNELAVTVEDNQLTVRGRRQDDDGKTFLHRGIAARQFIRNFVLADGIEVACAALENGLLKIDLARPPSESRIRTIEIKSGE